MKSTIFSHATWLFIALMGLSFISCQSDKNPSAVADVNIDSLVNAKVEQKMKEQTAAQEAEQAAAEAKAAAAEAERLAAEADEEVEEVDPIIAHEAERAQGNPCSGDFYFGTIGGDNHCQVNMPTSHSMGNYTFLNFTRNLAFQSYDPRTRTLTLTAYERGSGKYIGKFVGKYGRDGNYKGVFTNYKGAKVNFDLDIAGD